MNAQQVFDFAVKSLSSLYEKREAENIAIWLLEDKLGLTRAGLQIHGQEVISEVKANELAFKLTRLLKGEPIQYVLGYSEFYGLRLKVNKSVLIPRPETEELVDWIINECKGEAPLNILDIGTGSGCIAIALKKNLPQSTCIAIDVSENALRVAGENARLNEADIHFLKLDILSENPSLFPGYLAGDDPNFQIIVSNPPYIPDHERASMHKNVVEFEPHEALFVADEDPLQFYAAIAEFSKTNLSPGGRIFFEMSEQQGSSLASLMKTFGYQHVDIRKDLNGKERMMCIRR